MHVGWSKNLGAHLLGLCTVHALYTTVQQCVVGQMTMCGDSRLVIILVALLSSSIPSTLADEHSHSVRLHCIYNTHASKLVMVSD